MEIRPATPDDVPAVLPMVRRVAALHAQWDPVRYAMDDDPGRLYDGWLRQRATDPRSVFLVAQRQGDEKGGQLVGFLVGEVEREIPIYRVREYGFIHDLWVEEDYRHEGLGRQLTMLAIEKFRDMGVTQARLHTAGANDPARKLFEQCGFRVSLIEMLCDLEPGSGGVEGGAR